MKKKPEYANHKILILDDDKLQLQLLQEMLRRIVGDTWQVFACDHVMDALTTLHNEQPALMLMDIEMPEMERGSDMIAHINHTQDDGGSDDGSRYKHPGTASESRL